MAQMSKFCILTTKSFTWTPIHWISPSRSGSLFSVDYHLIYNPGLTPKKPPKIFCRWFQWHKWVNSAYWPQNPLCGPQYPDFPRLQLFIIYCRLSPNSQPWPDPKKTTHNILWVVPMAQMSKFWVLTTKYFTWTPIHAFPPAAAVHNLVHTIT